ncbi:uncharacterized protein LOC118765571 [Octopus sinensis]|uniref:Uncharacterized protein LOC118765571 n=1 Tax=Octopus sinensis TaxID=2607531 RepID=A0A7E6F848_9MOLL|nr:uncharacterized protein LOC118765571 [Octopus sinensis]
MEKTAYRAVIKYLHLKGMTPSEIQEDMRGRESVEDDPRPRTPPTANIKDNLDLALGMMMQDRRISYHQIAERMGISIERAVNIVTKELGFSKVSAWWVPR